MEQVLSAEMLEVRLEVPPLSLSSASASWLEVGRQGRAGGCQGAQAAWRQGAPGHLAPAPGRASSSAKPAPGPGQAGWPGASLVVGGLGGKLQLEKQQSL